MLEHEGRSAIQAFFGLILHQKAHFPLKLFKDTMCVPHMARRHIPACHCLKGSKQVPETLTGKMRQVKHVPVEG